jgi:hypothetical protein
MSKSHKNSGKTTLDNLNIINSINYMGSIPYSINTKVLKHLLNLIQGSANKDKINELIKLNIHSNTKNMFKLNLTHKYGELNEIAIHNSQFYNNKSIILSAILFSSWCESSHNNSLYFNYFID